MNLISCLALNCSVLSHDWEVIVARLRGTLGPGPGKKVLCLQKVGADRMRDDVEPEALATRCEMELCPIGAVKIIIFFVGENLGTP